MSRQRVLKELSTGSALLFAGSQYGPDACIPLSAHQGTATLVNPPVNDSLTKRLHGGIIGRWHRRIKRVLWLLLGERGPPLEKKYFHLELQPLMCYKVN
ncbi:MAG: hypothetical protein QGD96_11990 [Anaerolineae bacterium]|nr:hypothetical protein [Anaerolineae bacterium]